MYVVEVSACCSWEASAASWVESNRCASSATLGWNSKDRLDNVEANGTGNGISGNRSLRLAMPARLMMGMVGISPFILKASPQLALTVISRRGNLFLTWQSQT